MGLKSLAQKLFSRSLRQEDIKLVKTAELLSPTTGRNCFYVAQKEADGFFKISRFDAAATKYAAADFSITYFLTPYTLGESLEILSALEKKLERAGPAHKPASHSPEKVKALLGNAPDAPFENPLLRDYQTAPLSSQNAPDDILQANDLAFKLMRSGCMSGGIKPQYP